MADLYTIDLPISRRLGSISPRLVRGRSKMTERKYVEKLAYYFKREFHFDFVQYEANESESWESPSYVPSEVWLFHTAATDHVRDVGDQPRRVIGAACFRREDIPQALWALDWIWFHPYERGRGHLTRCWPEWEQRYGRFQVEEPLSQAMIRFLAKMRPSS